MSFELELELFDELELLSFELELLLCELDELFVGVSLRLELLSFELELRWDELELFELELFSFELGSVFLIGSPNKVLNVSFSFLFLEVSGALVGVKCFELELELFELFELSLRSRCELELFELELFELELAVRKKTR